MLCIHPYRNKESLHGSGALRCKTIASSEPTTKKQVQDLVDALVHHGLIAVQPDGTYNIPGERMGTYVSGLADRITAVETVDVQNKIQAIDAAFQETMGYISNLKQENERIKSVIQEAEKELVNTMFPPPE